MNIFLTITKDYIVHAVEILHTLRKFSSLHVNARILVNCYDISAIQHFFDSLNIDRMDIAVIGAQWLDDNISPKIDPSIGKMAYGKLQIFKDCADLDKVLFLDGDVLIKNNGLDDLYNLDICNSNYYVGAVEEMIVEAYDEQEMINCKTRRYFNSGVMLLNVKKILADGIGDQCIQMLRNPPSFMQIGSTDLHCLADQTIFNTYFREHVMFINPKFNVQAELLGYPIYEKFAQSIGYSGQRQLAEYCVVQHMQWPKPWESRWNSRLPFKKINKQWQYDYYIEVRDEVHRTYPQLKTLATLSK